MIEDHKTIDKNSNVMILSKHSKCERKLTRFITKNSNEISTIDYAICSKMLSKNIIKVSINDQKVRQNRLEYNPNRKRKKNKQRDNTNSQTNKIQMENKL